MLFFFNCYRNLFYFFYPPFEMENKADREKKKEENQKKKELTLKKEC